MWKWNTNRNMWKNFVFETREDAIRVEKLMYTLELRGCLTDVVDYFGVGSYPNDVDEMYERTLLIKFKPDDE